MLTLHMSFSVIILYVQTPIELMLGEIRQGFPKVINGIPIHLVRINEVIKRTIRSNENSIGTSGDFDLLLLLLDWVELLSDGRAVLAFVAFEDLLDL